MDSSSSPQSSTCAVPPHQPGAKGITSPIIPHLVCKGAAAAMDFYKRAFGAVEMVRMPGDDGRLMHGAIRVGESMIMLADEFPEWGSSGPQDLKCSPVTLHLYVTNVDAAIETAVRAGATVTMPPADMFWGDRYGKIRDPFGHEWSLATKQHDYTPEQIKANMEKAMKEAGPGCGSP